ncbi:glycosyltransferase family 4 protein [Infirmifilum sp.]|uniref:glycosyltransferase family 4 protein n=1 Tax=Infirmifilum sp. TaxID=2856575 RepID=UPI003D118FB0
MTNLLRLLLQLVESRGVHISVVSNVKSNELAEIAYKVQVINAFPESTSSPDEGSSLLLTVRSAAELFIYLLKLRNNCNIVLLTLGAELAFHCILLFKLLRKKIVLMLAGNARVVYKQRKHPLYPVAALFHVGAALLADRIVVYSPSLVESYGLRHVAFKVRVAREHHLNFNLFKRVTRVAERPNIIGYVGRLHAEKNPLSLVKAMRYLKGRGLKLVVIGDGPLRGAIERLVKAYGLEGEVELLGWVPREELVRHYNRMKLLVLPSLTEGLPNVVLEAMACGTPVLATPVGAIPDIIRDGVTGFLLRSTEPKHIAEKISELLANPELLESVSERALAFVRSHFTYEYAARLWQSVLDEVTGKSVREC